MHSLVVRRALSDYLPSTAEELHLLAYYVPHCYPAREQNVPVQTRADDGQKGTFGGLGAGAPARPAAPTDQSLARPGDPRCDANGPGARH